MVLQRLKDAAEKAKIELSSVQETTINLPFLTADAGGPEAPAEAAHARQARADDRRRSSSARWSRCKKALADAKKHAEARSHEVVLVGGSTRIPLVQETVKKFFGKEPHKGVNPDEVVAIGAAVQAGVLSGDVKDMVLLDVTPLSLGVETLGGVMTVMIPRNTTIPTQKKEIFSTATDSQPSVEVHVLQGERTEARYNRTLGSFHLEGIMPAPRGVPKIEVTFDIDANGILSRPRQGHGDRQGSAASPSPRTRGLNEDEIQKMVKEAAEHEAEDKERREQIERRNKLDNLCYTLEKTIAENKDKLPAADVAALEALIKEARAAIEKQDDDARDGRAREAREGSAPHRQRDVREAPGGAPRRRPRRRPDGDGGGAAAGRGRRAREGRRDRRRVRRDELSSRRGRSPRRPLLLAVPGRRGFRISEPF